MRGKGCIIHFLFVLLVLDQARGVHGSSYMHARHVSARAAHVCTCVPGKVES